MSVAEEEGILEEESQRIWFIRMSAMETFQTSLVTTFANTSACTQNSWSCSGPNLVRLQVFINWCLDVWIVKILSIGSATQRQEKLMNE